MEQAIADLDDERYAVRAEAAALLQQQGFPAAQRLRLALKDGISLERRKRIELLLAKVDRFTPQPTELGALRALAVLERIGDSPARQLLEVLATGAPYTRLTQQAQAALQRLAKTKA
jgi:hypothetical protein